MSEQTTPADSDIVESVDRIAAGREVELIEWVFSADVKNPFPAQLLHLFYEMVSTNKLGIMQAKSTLTGSVDNILVGVDRNEEGELVTYPLARILNENELGTYLAPRGDGTFIGDEEDVPA
jgi:hypothetical protein